MGIPHRHGNSLVSHKLLHGANVYSGHHKAASERMLETMPAKRSQTGCLHGRLKPEFERELIRDRVKAGMKNAKAKGARIGRPRVTVDAFQIARLRDSGASLRTIAARLGVSLGTVAACSRRLPRRASVVA